MAKAEAQLQAVIHADDAPVGMAAMARLSLARVYLQAGQPQQALATLKVQSASFAALYAEARGDAYAALRQPDPAMQAYGQALAKLPATDPYRAYLQMKMANIGVAP
jgi:predicted negative regulator of RcsB-dependent stress response